MIQTQKSDKLLNEIARTVGLEFLSDLRQIRSPDLLLTAFSDVEQDCYTIDEWKEALAYISCFDEQCFLPQSESREIVLWNAGQWGRYITETMVKYFSSRKLNGCFHYITGCCGPVLPPGKRYLMFYYSSGLNREEVRDFAKQSHLNMSFAAICTDYNDGIQSMDKGDCYALKLPLEEEKIIRCYEHFNAINEKEIPV